MYFFLGEPLLGSDFLVCAVGAPAWSGYRKSHGHCGSISIFATFCSFWQGFADFWHVCAAFEIMLTIKQSLDEGYAISTNAFTFF